MTDNFKHIHGIPLIEAGYKIVPIKTGEKHPRTKGWPQIRATAADVTKWSKTRYYGGLGVLGQFTPGIDIDVYDRETVELLVKWCMKNIGIAPIRTGNAPRVLIPCAAPPGGLGPDNTPKYEDTFGSVHQIEIKATGQQWVAYGVHPTTGNPYTWAGGELHTADADFLPTLTGEKIDALFKYFESIIPSDWVKKKKGRNRRRQGGLSPDGQLEHVTAFENYRPPIHIEADRLRSMLAVLDPDLGHNEWLTVGMALYHQFEGDDEGKELFLEWSERSVEYDAHEIEQRWPTWAAKSYGGHPVTAATIIQMYNEATKTTSDPTRRPKSKYLSDWERRFCLVEQPDGSEVHDAGVPLYKAPRRTLRAFREHNSAYTYRSMTPEGDVKIEPMVEAWKSSKNTKHYAGYTYQPGADRFCRRENCYGDDSQYVNTFYYPPHPDVQDFKRRLPPFLDFLRHLFPEKKERRWLVEWLARLIQNPGTRSFVAPINITPVTGTGRGILFEILKLIIGGHNSHDVSRDDMEGRFNGFLDKCIIAVVQEIKAATGDKKYQVWERMKSLLADTSSNIQAKGQDSYTATIYANFLMFSNHIDALPLQDVNERRIYAMRGADRPINTDEIDTIIAWKNDADNIACLFTYLKAYPVEESNFKRAPKSATKIQMVAAALGPAGSDLAEWLAEEAPLVFDYDYAVQALEQYSEDMAATGISRDRFRRTLADRGYHSTQIRTEDKRRVYVYFHPGTVNSGPKKLKTLHNKPRE